MTLLLPCTSLNLKEFNFMNTVKKTHDQKNDISKEFNKNNQELVINMRYSPLLVWRSIIIILIPDYHSCTRGWIGALNVEDHTIKLTDDAGVPMSKNENQSNYDYVKP